MNILQPFKTMTATLKNLKTEVHTSLIYIFFFFLHIFFITKSKKYFMFVLNILQSLYKFTK